MFNNLSINAKADFNPGEERQFLRTFLLFVMTPRKDMLAALMQNRPKTRIYRLPSGVVAGCRNGMLLSAVGTAEEPVCGLEWSPKTRFGTQLRCEIASSNWYRALSDSQVQQARLGGHGDGHTRRTASAAESNGAFLSG